MVVCEEEDTGSVLSVLVTAVLTNWMSDLSKLGMKVVGDSMLSAQLGRGLIVGHATFLVFICYVLHGYGFCLQQCIWTDGW